MMEFCAKNGRLFCRGKHKCQEWEEFHMKGVSYFGMETDIAVPHGLWGSTTLEQLLKFIQLHNFNTIRLPFSVQYVLENALIDSSKVISQGPAWADKRYLEIMDLVVEACERHNLLVVLDAHLLSGGESPIPPLWYSDSVPETKVIEAWEILAARYGETWNVIGADITNEPHDEASWGTKVLETDWKMAAERIGNALLKRCSRWLVFVEGVSDNIEGLSHIQPSFWGGNLQGVCSNPVRLKFPEKLVYSPHVYGPAVYVQSYFKEDLFPENMPDIWTEQFGFLMRIDECAPAEYAVIVGEYGGTFSSENGDDEWEKKFLEYLVQNGIGSIYWCLNPNSSDTGGLLQDDWKTPQQHKLDALSILPFTMVEKFLPSFNCDKNEVT